MKNKIPLPLLAAATGFLITGCATDAHYVQTGDKEQVVSLGQINIQDYANAANAAINDLLQSGALDKIANPPAILEISRIINNTGQQVDTDLLTQKISSALLRSGKAVTTSVDAKANGYSQEAVFTSEGKTRLPDFTLSGKIIETIDRAGSTSRTTYSFQLSLNDAKAGLQVWEGEHEVGKQSTRPPVGF